MFFSKTLPPLRKKNCSCCCKMCLLNAEWWWICTRNLLVFFPPSVLHNSPSLYPCKFIHMHLILLAWSNNALYMTRLFCRIVFGAELIDEGQLTHTKEWDRKSRLNPLNRNFVYPTCVYDFAIFTVVYILMRVFLPWDSVWSHVLKGCSAECLEALAKSIRCLLSLNINQVGKNLLIKLNRWTKVHWYNGLILRIKWRRVGQNSNTTNCKHYHPSFHTWVRWG